MDLSFKHSHAVRIGLCTIALLVSIADAGATPAFYSIDLRNTVQVPLPASLIPFVSYVVSPVDSNSDSWYETVLKVNLRNPAFSDPYQYAEFRVIYDGVPYGLTVNIGDSSTNDGGSGDAATQSNDAELQIGALLTDPPEFPTLRVFGNDNAPPADKVLVTVPGFADVGRDIILTISNQVVSWDNRVDARDYAVSPYLYALDGQPDSEGPVNYDVFVAFNRVVSGPRMGAGVGNVEMCLGTAGDSSCFIPEPGTLPLAVAGLVALGFGRRWNNSRKT